MNGIRFTCGFSIRNLVCGLGILICGLELHAAAQSDKKVETVATFPSTGQTENICEASDGAIFITGMADRVVWKVERNGTLREFANVPALAALVGVASSDTGVVVTAFERPFRRPVAGGQGGTQIDFSDVGSQILIFDNAGTLVTTVHGQKGQAFNGLTRVRGDFYLIADSNAATLWQFDLSTKRVEPWLTSDTLAPVATSPVGANGVKVHDGWVYVSVGSRGGIYRIKMGADGKPQGTLALFAKIATDDFDIADDGNIYVPSGSGLSRVSPEGDIVKLLDAVQGGAAALVSRGSRWLYWPTRGGDGPQRLLRMALQ